jgi:SPX domain protein involved in polyphosphate accumulation
MQYVNFEELKKQLALLDQCLSTQASRNNQSLTWMKLVFQHTLDSEISKVLGFYVLRKKELKATLVYLQQVERPLCLAALNVRPPYLMMMPLV